MQHLSWLATARMPLATLLLAACLPCNAEQKEEPLRRNALDDWGMGFADCLRRHTMGCQEFAAAYARLSQDGPTELEYVVGTEGPLRKVFRDKFMFHGRYQPAVEVYAARNEAEAVQVCVIPAKHAKSIQDVRLAVTELKGPGGTIGKDDIEVTVVEYIQPEPVSYPVTYTGPWPDPLIPQGESQVNIPPLELRPFWVEVSVSQGTAAGEYQGTLRVTAGNSHELSLPMRVHVWDFAVPAEVHMPIETHLRRGCLTVSGKAEEEDAAFRRYVECFLRHRISVGPACPVPIPDDPAYEKLDRELEWAIGKGMNTFSIQLGGSDDEKKKEFVALCNHLRDKGWLKYAKIHVGIDEPDVEHYPKVVEHAKAIKSLVPDLRTWVTESPHPDLLGPIDVFGSDICTEREEWNAMARKAGAEVQYSLCHIPVRAQFLRSQHQAPNLILDVPAVWHRVVFWLAWVNEIRGITFWGGNSEWPKDLARTWPAKPMPAKWPGDDVYSGVHNGNGITVYPGKDGTPWASIRMKTLRDGSEDYEYLWLLREHLKERPDAEAGRLLTPVPTVCVTPTYFNPMPDGILGHREKLARAIVAIRQNRK